MSFSTSGDENGAEPPGLRRLRRLVTGLTATLIVGVITVVALLVIRLTDLSSAPPSLPLLPPALALPASEYAGAVTFGAGWVAVVTIDEERRERIRVFDAEDGTSRGVLEIAAVR